MRPIILTVIILICITAISAQEETTSKIKEFQSQKGVLIVKEFFDIGSVKGQYGSDLELSIVRITNPNGNVSLKGLKLSSTKKSSYTSDEKIAFLDEDEVDALISALQYMIQVQEQIGSDKNKPYTEYIFSAKDSFNIGFLISKGEYTAFSSVGSIGAITAVFKYSDLNAVLAKAQAAKSKLMSL